MLARVDEEGGGEERAAETAAPAETRTEPVASDTSGAAPAAAPEAPAAPAAVPEAPETFPEPPETVPEPPVPVGNTRTRYLCVCATCRQEGPAHRAHLTGKRAKKEEAAGKFLDPWRQFLEKKT